MKVTDLKFFFAEARKRFDMLAARMATLPEGLPDSEETALVLDIEFARVPLALMYETLRPGDE